MDNYENNNNNEYSNPTEENPDQLPKYDTASDVKKKLIFFVVLIVIMIAVNYSLGY